MDATERLEKRRIVVKTAKELAGAYFEEQHSERFRKFWPKVDVFIHRNWPNFLPMARSILTAMLRPQCKDVSEKQKEEIFEALKADAEQSARQPQAKVGRGPMILRPDQPGKIEQFMFWKK